MINGAEKHREIPAAHSVPFSHSCCYLLSTALTGHTEQPSTERMRQLLRVFSVAIVSMSLIPP